MQVSILSDAGLTEPVLGQVDQLVVGCGGFVEELISFTAGSSLLKDDSGQRLSAADIWVDQLLRDNLTRLVPGSSGYSEEGLHFGEQTGGIHVRWMLDPVDGTRPALLGGAFAVSAAAVVLHDAKVRAAVGWIYVPTLRALYRGILTPELAECRCNAQPAGVHLGVRTTSLRNLYLAVNSDWHSSQLQDSPLKVSAPGATAVHLTQLVQPGSDVGAVLLSRYRPYDAAGGLVIAAAGGARVRRLPGAAGAAGGFLCPLELLESWCGREGEDAERFLVAAPELLDILAPLECG